MDIFKLYCSVIWIRSFCRGFRSSLAIFSVTSEAALSAFMPKVLSETKPVFLITISLSSLNPSFKTAFTSNLSSFARAIIFILFLPERNFFKSLKLKSELTPIMQSALLEIAMSFVNYKVVLCFARTFLCPKAVKL